MMKKIALAALLAVFSTASVWAAPVDASKARVVALSAMRAAGMQKVDRLVDVSASTPFTSLYIFAASSGGFVIVSADDCALPILGYSLTSRFPAGEAMPAHVSEWLAAYDKQIAHDSRHRRKGSEQVAEQWQMLLSGTAPSDMFATVVSPLLSTTWNQSPRYNNYCPYDEGKNELTVTGCVATATAQVMKYWEHPTTGYGSHTYKDKNYGDRSANFGATTYQWASMPSALTSSSSSEEVDAVATLMYHVGVADEMSYGVASTGGSSARNYYSMGLVTSSSEYSLTTYFKYRPDIVNFLRSDHSDAEYCARLRAELDQSRPILYQGSNTSAGHSFVLDGYDAEGRFHVNWGWGGYRDGFFVMGSLNPGSSGIGGNGTNTYNMHNCAMLNIRPNDNWSPTAQTIVSVASVGDVPGCSVIGAGTYNYGDTVTLGATAVPGYRFDGWSDGSKFNYRQFIANGGSYSFTANFVPITGDTLYYCPGGYVAAYGTGTNDHNAYWGIKLPTSLTDPSKSLTSVQLFVGSAGNYDMTIYTGAAHSTIAYTTSLTYTDDDIDQWQSIPIPSPIEANSDIWIIFHSSDVSYPATFSHWAGVENSFIWGADLEDYSNICNVSAMVRGIFTDLSLPAPGTDSNCVINSFPYTMDFEGSLACWSLLDQDGDGNTWGIADGSGLNGSRCIAIGSGNTSDDWLVSPAIVTPARFNVSWKTRVASTSYPETYQLWALYKDTNIMLFEETLRNRTSYTSRLVELLVNPADTVHLAFRYVSESQLGMYIDSITISYVSARYTLQAQPADPAQGTVSGSGVYDDAAYAVIAARPSTHYHFLRWNDGNTDNPRLLTITSDTSFTAFFELNRYSVAATTSQTNRGTVSGSDTYEALSTATLTATANYGFSFLMWNDSITDNPRQLLVASDTNLSALFDYDTNVSFTIRAISANANRGTVSGAGIYKSGSTITLRATPKPGYRLFQWSDGTTDTNLTLTVEKAATYIAIFEAIPRPSTFTLTLHSADTLMGTVSGTGTYRADTTLTIRAIPNPGYHFTYWSDSCTLATRTLTLSSDSTLTAYFDADIPTTFTLTVLSADTLMGTVSGAGPYTEGSLATLTATPNDGYRFIRWDDGNTNATRTVIVTANATYTAHFDHITYTLTALSADTLMGTVSGSGIYIIGTPVTITATPKPNHHFLSWNDGDTNATRTIILTSDTLLTATFAPGNASILTVEQLALNLTPNPATTTAILRWSSPSEAIITIYSATGTLIATHRVAESSLTLDVSAYAPGLYLIRITSAGISATCKLIVK